MEIFIKVNGKMEWPMDKELFAIIRAVFMKESGLKINNTVKEQSIGIIIKLNTMEILLKVKKQEKENSNVKGVHTMVILLMDNSMAKVLIILQIQERFIKEASYKTSLMVKEK
jgi:hypothetical protein